MKKPWLIGAVAMFVMVLAMFTLLVVLGLTRPQGPKVTLALMGRSSTGYSDIRFTFATTNMTSRKMHVAVAPKRVYLDYMRGEVADLQSKSGAGLSVLLPGDQTNWAVVARFRRIPSRPESWLRALGARLQLCFADPKWEETATIEVQR